MINNSFDPEDGYFNLKSVLLSVNRYYYIIFDETILAVRLYLWKTDTDIFSIFCHWGSILYEGGFFPIK